jgi:hypothetical protein
MAHFGARYLTPAELRQQFRVFTDKYYAWLVAALIENSFDQQFLEEQRRAMRALGFELSTARIVKAGLMRGVELVEHPGVTSQKISQMLRRKGKIEARGTSLT